MQSQATHGKMLTVRNGYLVCPSCLKNKQVMKISPDTVAWRVVAYCRTCKTEHIVDIEQGRCFKSRGQ